MRKFLPGSLLLCFLLGCAVPIVRFDHEIKGQILEEIRNSTRTIDIAMYRFTDTEVIKVLRQVKDKDKVRVRVILDYESDSALFSDFGDVRVMKKRMHHKFCIFDGKRVMTGSYNITGNAYKNNYENAIFLSDPGVVKAYQDRFNNLFDKGTEILSKGSGR
jgi:phosphatidylserine/phosphatidylglycerophosphate/cardiolipin synthase-like enzyme